MVRRLWLAVAATSAHAATICPRTDAPAPDVVTLMASTSFAATEAWVVAPDCTVTSVALAPQGDEKDVLDLDDLGIEHVVSVPTDAKGISTRGNPLSHGADFSKAIGIRSMELSTFPTDLRKLVLPPALLSLFLPQLSATNVTSLDGIALPASLENLVIGLEQVTSLKNVQLPTSLQSLVVVRSPLKLIDVSLPPDLSSLAFASMTTPAFSTLERLQIPSKLLRLQVTDCRRATIRGVKWPSTLQSFDFAGTNIDVFEIRQSDVATFQNLEVFQADVSQTVCRGAGELKTVKDINICVISDSDFDLLYSLPSTTTPVPPAPSRVPTAPSPTPTTTKRGSPLGSGNSGLTPDLPRNEIIDPPSLQTSTRKPSSPREDDTVADTTDDEQGPDSAVGSASSSQQSTRPPTAVSPKASSNRATSTRNSSNLEPAPTQPPDTTPTLVNTTSATTSRNSLTIIVLACGLSFVVGGLVFRVLVRKWQRERQDSKLVDDSTNDTYTRTDTPTFLFETPQRTETPVIEPTLATLHALRVAFMTDQDLVRCRIDQVELGSKIAEGSTGAVYRGSHRGRVVAVKQLPSEAWTTSTGVAKFLEEIRSCARLDHPKIVEFIGATWSGGRDLAAVSEFMAGGDLKTVLYSHPSSTGSEWASPWTEKQLRSKTLIALDVVEALVYLHSFETPILHRDLTAKNVLLDTKGNAKISEIGIGCKLSNGASLTSSMSMTAWIAPEVLRGERYTVKADIYSFGVLLVEMDRCNHPYASEPLLMTESGSSSATNGETQAMIAHKNTQIAVLVSTGEVRPSPTPQCPDDVKQVVARCLSDEASDRPTAMEVVYQLRQVRKAQENEREIA